MKPGDIEKEIVAKQHANPNFLLCRHREKDWSGADPECGFNEDGTFRTDNWRCWLLSQVRSLMGQYDESAPGHYWWDDDQNYGVLYVSTWVKGKPSDSYLRGCFIIMDWYKSRGATDSFSVLEDNIIRDGTEEDAEELVRLYSEFIIKGEDEDG